MGRATCRFSDEHCEFEHKSFENIESLPCIVRMYKTGFSKSDDYFKYQLGYTEDSVHSYEEKTTEYIRMFLRLRRLVAPIGQFVINKGRQNKPSTNSQIWINKLSGGGISLG